MSQDEKVVNDQVDMQEPTAAESTPAENKEPEVADPMLKALSDDDDEALETSASTETKETTNEEGAEEDVQDDDTSTESTAEQEQPRGEEQQLSPKAENRFQKLANENKRLREYIEQINSQVYQPQTTEELIDEGLSPEMAEVRSLKQSLELQAYNNKVIEAQTYLSNDSERVLKEFPIFDPGSEEYQEDLAEAAAESLREALITDPNTGQIVGSHLSPYQIYKPIADAYRKSQVKGKIEGQRATEKMLANVDAKPSLEPKKPKKDPLLEILTSDD